ncbi:MAG: hypothetical protein B6D59_06145 [Campylobacteraceae bacterium 4484_4]|nr:MAG: hypothetical protein B6D59_06145 [Campylobacteraceae bacterium 4484_4]
MSASKASRQTAVTFKKVFLDANILIDLFDSSRQSFHESKRIYTTLYQNDVTICTSCDIATTVYYLTARSVNTKEALEAIEIINQTIHILPFGNDQIEQAIALMRNAYRDFEDTLQYISAKESGCEAIISNDKNFTAKDIPLFSSKEFVAKYL